MRMYGKDDLSSGTDPSGFSLPPDHISITYFDVSMYLICSSLLVKLTSCDLIYGSVYLNILIPRVKAVNIR